MPQRAPVVLGTALEDAGEDVPVDALGGQPVAVPHDHRTLVPQQSERGPRVGRDGVARAIAPDEHEVEALLRRRRRERERVGLDRPDVGEAAREAAALEEVVIPVAAIAQVLGGALERDARLGDRRDVRERLAAPRADLQVAATFRLRGDALSSAISMGDGSCSRDPYGPTGGSASTTSNRSTTGRPRS
jgi:hypothetical protein